MPRTGIAWHAFWQWQTFRHCLTIVLLSRTPIEPEAVARFLVQHEQANLR
jgi:hypothetical protein